MVKVFVTGGTGFVGTHLIPALLAGGHTVTALSRSEANDTKLTSFGATPVKGSLEDPSSLARLASDADATIHLAFDHDFARWAEVCQKDRENILAVAEAYAGTGKRAIAIGGFLIKHDPSRPLLETDEAPEDDYNARAQTEKLFAAYADKGMIPITVRLAASVHGKGDHAFAPALIGFAKQNGLSAYVEGQGKWSGVHVKDAAELLVAAMEKGQARKRYHGAEDDGIPFQLLAEAIAKGTGVPAKAVAPEEFGKYVTWLQPFASSSLAASSEITRKELGWAPKEVSLLEDLEKSGYFAE